jgi:hypothetical protein
MHASIDALIARLALSLWTSAKRIERLSTVTVVHQWEIAAIVPFPAELAHTVIVNRYEGI